MRTSIVLALATFSVAMLPAPAAAETVSVAVPYGDLDLSTAAGMATLNGRIATAAKRICGGADVRSFRDTVDHNRCMQETHRSARVYIARLTGNRAVLAQNSGPGSRP